MPIPGVVSVPVFLTVFFCASGALALWIDSRLANKGPTSLRSVVVFLASGLLALQLAKSVAGAKLSPESPLVNFALLFGVVLPALVFVFLTTIWLLKLLRSAMPR
jgi:hypothetical protein